MERQMATLAIVGGWTRQASRGETRRTEHASGTTGMRRLKARRSVCGRVVTIRRVRHRSPVSGKDGEAEEEAEVAEAEVAEAEKRRGRDGEPHADRQRHTQRGLRPADAHRRCNRPS